MDSSEAGCTVCPLTPTFRPIATGSAIYNRWGWSTSGGGRGRVLQWECSELRIQFLRQVGKDRPADGVRKLQCGARFGLTGLVRVARIVELPGVPGPSRGLSQRVLQRGLNFQAGLSESHQVVCLAERSGMERGTALDRTRGTPRRSARIASAISAGPAGRPASRGLQDARVAGQRAFDSSIRKPGADSSRRLVPAAVGRDPAAVATLSRRSGA